MTTTEPITANGTFFFGLSDSPASSMACRKPRKEKVIPPVAMAVSMPWVPSVVKPWSPKLPLWNSVTRNAKTTRMMMANFHQTATLLTRANQRMP